MPDSSLLSVDGTVTFRERLALPPGAVATVKLVDAEGEVLAGTAVDAEGGATPFSLLVDPADVVDARRLYLWAKLRSEVGVWGTTELVHVVGDSTDVVVTRVDA